MDLGLECEGEGLWVIVLLYRYIEYVSMVILRYPIVNLIHSHTLISLPFNPPWLLGSRRLKPLQASMPEDKESLVQLFGLCFALEAQLYLHKGCG